MGVTIHYRGSIDEPERIWDLQRETESLGDLSGLSTEEIASRIEDFLRERQ